VVKADEERVLDNVDVGSERVDEEEGLLPIEAVGARRCILLLSPDCSPSKLGFEVFFRGELALLGECLVGVWSVKLRIGANLEDDGFVCCFDVGDRAPAARFKSWMETAWRSGLLKWPAWVGVAASLEDRRCSVDELA
jgi:hypothetical protein